MLLGCCSSWAATGGEMRKKLEPEIRRVIENGVESRQRSLFVVVGGKGRHQVVNLHNMLSKSVMKAPSVLWCYEKELFSEQSAEQKRIKQVNKMKRTGQLVDAEDEDFSWQGQAFATAILLRPTKSLPKRSACAFYSTFSHRIMRSYL